MRGEHRLRVELDALGGQLAVAGAHHHAAEVGGQLELVGEVGVGDQRVVAAGDHRGRQPGVDRLAVVLDLGVLAVDRLALDDLAAEDLDHRLVAEADAEHRRPGLGEGADRLAGDPRLGGRAGAGRDDEAVGAALQQLADLGLVVADHLELGAELTQVLDQVVGEGVVVVDDEDASCSPAAQAQSGWAQATSTARKTARALFTDSLYS